MRIFIFLFTFMGIVALGSWFSFTIFKMYGVFRNPFIYKIILTLYVLLPIIFLITNIIGRTTYSKINSFFYTISAVWIGALLYLFMTAFVLAFLYFFIKTLPIKVLFIIGTQLFLLTWCVVIYALYNASMPTVTTFEVVAPRLAPLWSNKKIILFSDTHLGNVRGKQFTQKVVDLVNSQKPDLVLMAGDMIDGPKIPYTDFADPFKDIRSTYGTYYTPGNHEWYNIEPDIFLNVMKNITKELIDDKIRVNGTELIGINYAEQTKEGVLSQLKKTKLDKNIPSISIMHDPKYNDLLRENGVDLVVSGHTHCGQFWPLNYIVKAVYGKKMHGVRQFENSATVTTCGIGTAMVPFRLGNTPEIVVIEIFGSELEKPARK